MATTNISNAIRLNNANATSAADSFLPSANAAYGPHQTLEEAKRQASTIFNGNIPLGLTVAVKSGSTIKEYWNPSSANTFIEKQAASSGGGGNLQVYTIETVVEDTTTWLDTTFSDADVGAHVVETTTGKVYIKYSTGHWVVLNGTILSDAVPTVAKIVNAHVLSYK